MAMQIKVESNLALFLPPISERLGLPHDSAGTPTLVRPDQYISISVARSPQNQIVTYPAITCKRRGNNFGYQPLNNQELSATLQTQSIAMLKEEPAIYTANFIFDKSGGFLRIFPGLTRESLWTLEFAYTSHFENALRAVHDLPLGSAQNLFESWYLLEFSAPSHLDMVKPYLHLFAHNPNYRVVKLSQFTGFVALAGEGNLISSAEHAVDYLEGVIDE